MEKRKDIREELYKEILTLSLTEQALALNGLKQITQRSRIERDCLNCSAAGKSINSTVLS